MNAVTPDVNPSNGKNRGAARVGIGGPVGSGKTRLLEQLHIDSRRVAVEHNFIVLKRTAYDTTTLAEGDQVEIVNFVGGGEAVRTLR